MEDLFLVIHAPYNPEPEESGFSGEIS